MQPAGHVGTAHAGTSSDDAPESERNLDVQIHTDSGFQVTFMDAGTTWHMWTTFAATELEEEGPIAYYVTYFIHTARHPVCMRGRAARLLGDSAEIIGVWEDSIIAGEPVLVYPVVPTPPTGHNQAELGI